MRSLTLILASLGSLLLVKDAAAFTPAEIDAAALVAADIDIVADIADDVYLGRPTGANALVQAFLLAELKLVTDDGLDGAAVGDDRYRQAFTRTCSKALCSTTCAPLAVPVSGTNLLGVIDADPLSPFASEYVLVGAHYDHLGASCGSPGGICNGATDNAAGVAIVLAIANAIQSLPAAPSRNVIVALWDAEEVGVLGSEAYVDAPLVALASTRAAVNFDVMGANLVPSLRDLTFAVGAESGGATLQNMVLNAIAQEDLGARLLSRAGGQDRSDHARFIDSVPTVFFSDGTGSCYHEPTDDIGAVDLEKLREQSQVGFRLVLDLAETATPPTFVSTLVLPPLSFGGVTYCWNDPVYEDAVLVRDVLAGASLDMHLFTSSEQSQLASHLAAVESIVAGGPAGFFCPLFSCLLPLGQALLFADATLQKLRCDSFGPVALGKTSTPAPAGAGLQLEYALSLENVGPRSEPSIAISDAVPAGASYVPGSASDGGSESGGLVSWPAVSLDPAMSVERSFRVDVSSALTNLPPASRFTDDVESGASQWSVSHASGSVDWQIEDTRADSGALSWFAENLATSSDQYLALAMPYAVPTSGASLAFHHYYDLQEGFDGGVVEYSTDGVVWNDLGPHVLENTYDSSISSCCGSPLAARPAFSGWSGGFIRSHYDLGAFAGSNLWLRFRLATDGSLQEKGWWIDDIEIGELLVGDAEADGMGAAFASVRHTTQVPEPGLPLALLSGWLALLWLLRRVH